MTFYYENQNHLDGDNQAVLEQKIEEAILAWKGEGIDFEAGEYRGNVRHCEMVFAFTVELLNSSEVGEEGWMPRFGDTVCVKRVA